jgi:diguanylate cyclase (GGDEF)-like protein
VPTDSRDEIGKLARAFNLMAARLENSQAALEEIATHDALTELFNRRECYARLKEEIKRSTRYGHIFSVMIIDLDFFKDVNDTYGHVVGDKVLKLIADMISKEVRPVDQVARYGGDEFILVLPETPMSSAVTLAERIRSVIAETVIPLAYGDSTSLTVSIGIACFPTDGQSVNDLISAADNMLYAAKGTGRNLVFSTRQPGMGADSENN